MSPATSEPGTVSIRRCALDGMVRRYAGQEESQPGHISLYLPTATLTASYDANTGGTPVDVAYGFDRRYDTPLLAGSAANRLMSEILPLAQRIVDDYTSEWDGKNTVAVLGPDAEAAEAELIEYLDDAIKKTDIVSEWDIDEPFDFVGDYGLTATTTDERLEEIAEKITARMASCNPTPATFTIVHGIEDALLRARDELEEAAKYEADEDEDEEDEK